jgi:ketosteroid isomerase-like protein
VRERASTDQEDPAMSTPTATTPEQAATALLEAFDALDLDALHAIFDDDPQGVDELSGGWRRGDAALDSYFAEITGAGIANVHSTLSDMETRTWGDTAVVTLVVDQTYDLGDESHAIRAPMTIVLRRREDGWRAAVVHAVALPE